MIAIDFTEEDIRYHHPLQRKMEALWLKHQGLPHSQIIAISPNTLRAYLRHYQTGGIDALKQLNYCPQESELLAHQT